MLGLWVLGGVITLCGALSLVTALIAWQRLSKGYAPVYATPAAPKVEA